MPKLATKIEGRGNGIKTNLVNMVDVAKALARPPSYTTKYFGCELGAQSKFDDKTGTATVNGAHEMSKLAGLLENFIKKYVQCYGCGNPETEIVISKTQLITLKCAACGYVSDVDMRNKLTTFILKNPPEQKKSGKDKKGMRRAEKERLKEGEVVDEESKKVKKDVKKKKGQDDEKRASKKKSGGSEDEQLSPVSSQADDDEDQEEDDGVQWQTDTSAEAAQRRINEQLTSATSEMVMLQNSSDDPQTAPRAKDTKDKDSKSKLKKRIFKNSETVAKDQDLPNVEELSLHNKLVKDFKACLKNGLTPAELASIVHSKDSPMQEVFSAYFQALFDGISKGLAKEVGKKKLYLAKVVHDEASQKLLLGAVEEFCSLAGSEMGKEVSLVLKTLYDEEIVEEEQILGWFDKGISKCGTGKLCSVRKHAHPFVEWLRNAEAESEEDE
ncbi:hypothetical protein O6H91_07G066400 [Diphasiastrum complanatum]|nr:hypothetical protein O6H91_07G066400 [Diphasiastrum complanatum]